MKINIIREFIRLCETKNYTRTAEELYISQSVLSRHIASLEEELGCQLISRSRTSFELTEAGKTTKESFEKILAEYQDLLSRLSSSETETGEIHVGVLYYDYSTYVEKIRKVFHAHYPNIRLHLHSYQPEQIEQDLLDGKIDAAFIYGVRALKRKDIRTMPFLRVPVSVMYDRSHRLASFEDLGVSDLTGEKILWPASHLELSQTSQIIRSVFASNHTEMSEYIPFTNFDEVPYLLKENNAVFISPMANSSAYPASVECRHLEPERYSFDISVVWRTDNKNTVLNSLLNAVRITYP